MSEPMRKRKQIPESYTPKKPEIAKMMKQAGMETHEAPPQYLIDTVFPTGDNPWVGGCEYLRCFASQYMHIEGMPPSHDTRYLLYRKFLAVTGMGMVTTFTDKPDEHNFSFEAAYDYIGRLHRFAGYGYRVIETTGQDKNALFNIIANSIYRGRPVLSVYSIGSVQNKTARFNRKWRLFVGYDCDHMTLSVNEDGTVAAMPDWFEKLDSVIIITQTGLPKPDMRDMLIEIINDAERSESQGEQYGYAAYEELITRLSDDTFFENADDATLQQFNNGGALGSFFWYHAETRGATGEGFGCLCGCSELINGELDGTEYKTDVNRSAFWGYNGHQISCFGTMVLRKGPAALRDKSHREMLIYGLRHLMSNDAKIVKMLKRAVGINTPDVLSPKDAHGQPVDYCLRAKNMLLSDSKDLIDEESAERMASLDAELILSGCKPVHVYPIDLNTDLEAVNTKIEWTADGLVMHSGEDWGGTGQCVTQQSFCAPVKIDACIAGSETNTGLFNIALFYNYGYFKCTGWMDKIDSHIQDIFIEYIMDYHPEFAAVKTDANKTDSVNISWIIKRDYVAVIIDGELVIYTENMPYTHFELPNAPVGVGGAAIFPRSDEQTVIIKSLTVSELERSV